MIISKPKNVLKTYLQSGAKGGNDSRPSSVIIDILCGKIDFIFSDTVITCDKDHSIFIPQGAKYQLLCHEYAESLLFNFQAIENPMSPMSLNAIARETAEDLFKQLNALFLNKTKEQNRIMSLYYQLFAEIFDTPENPSKTELFVKNAQQIMIDNFTSPSLKCSDVAKELNISEVYLRKLFAKHLNISPSKYLMELRMKKARLYILEGYSISETAQNVGYSDIYQFSRTYKKHYGHPPTATAKSG